MRSTAKNFLLSLELCEACGSSKDSSGLSFTLSMPWESNITASAGLVLASIGHSGCHHCPGWGGQCSKVHDTKGKLFFPV